jgi:hypothetical protein
MPVVSKEDVARLHAYLVVPVAVNEALSLGTPLDPDAQYGLHVALSEIEPDSALLAIALSAQRIAADFYHECPIAISLKIEADMVVAEYGPDWLANYHRHPMHGENLFDLLCNVPDDLESIADLLESLRTSIRDESHPAHALCGLLAVQARAHREIADYVLNELENEAIAFAIEEDGICHAPTPHLKATPGDNIILFPAHRRR